MGLKPNELKKDVFTNNDGCDPNFFVRIEHLPSGIVVTKHNSIWSTVAQAEALEELDMLVQLWSKESEE
jgi:protein subunit release factor A